MQLSRSFSSLPLLQQPVQPWKRRPIGETFEEFLSPKFIGDDDENGESSSRLRFHEAGEVENDLGFRHSNEVEHRHFGVSAHRGGNFLGFDEISAALRDDTCSCIIVVLTLWFFVSMTLILGIYGAENVVIGPNSSILLQPSPVFVRNIMVKEFDDGSHGIRLYSFYISPPRDVVNTWYEIYNTSVPAGSHKDWVYYLNEGSEINVSYSVDTPGSSIFLVIAKGSEGLAQWLEEPTYPNITLSWNVVHGTGIIRQSISGSSSYYLALANLNSENVEVKLNLTVRAYMYDTSKAYYKCTLTDEACSVSVLFPRGNAVVLTSPGPDQVSSAGSMYVTVSYGPRWITYISGVVIMLVAFNIVNKFQCPSHSDETSSHHGEAGSRRAPLLSHKDDDLSSLGSSYDSASNDDGDLEDFMLEGTSKDGENSTRRLCAICFDAPRNCFFLPCGHCVTCFECATRIVEAAGTCPVCHRNMKKVRMIFNV